MLNLSPVNKLILIGIAAAAVLVLVIRIALKWWKGRAAKAPPRRAAAPLPPPAAPAPAAPTSPFAASESPARSAYGYDDPSRPASTATPDSASESPSTTRSAYGYDNPPRPASTATPAPARPTPVVTAGGMTRRDVPGGGDSVPLDFDELPGTDDSDYRFGGVTPVLAAMLPESDDRRRAVTRSLRNAGEYGRHAWHNFAAVRYLGIVLPILFFGALLVVVPERLEGLMITGLVVGPILGWAIPTIMLQNRAQQRLGEVAQGIPDMLDILNMCVSQGMTVPTALGRVGRDLDVVYPALSKELKIVTEQARVGTLQQALAGFSQRCDIPEVHSFTSLLTQTEKMGTSLSAALVEYSDNMRETVKQRSDEKANSATFKLLFPTVLCLMPAVFLLLLGPAIVELSNFFNRGGTDILINSSRGIDQFQNR